MKRKSSNLGRTPGLDFLTVIILIGASVISLFPVLWGLSTALKTDDAVTMFPPEVQFQGKPSGKSRFHSIYELLFC